MQEQQDKRALRPMQASAPFPAGGPAGSFCPLSSTFPVVKQQRTPCAEEAGAKRKNAEVCASVEATCVLRRPSMRCACLHMARTDAMRATFVTSCTGASSPPLAAH